jgi:hypothetical protein
MSWVSLNLGRGEGPLIGLEGVVRNGVIVPDDVASLPEGTRVRIIVAPVGAQKPFGERFARSRGRTRLAGGHG